jgi:hypothetical protein
MAVGNAADLTKAVRLEPESAQSGVLFEALNLFESLKVKE